MTDAQMATIQLTRHRFHGDWNYTIRPATPRPLSQLFPDRLLAFDSFRATKFLSNTWQFRLETPDGLTTSLTPTTPTG